MPWWTSREATKERRCCGPVRRLPCWRRYGHPPHGAVARLFGRARAARFGGPFVFVRNLCWRMEDNLGMSEWNRAVSRAKRRQMKRMRDGRQPATGHERRPAQVVAEKRRLGPSP